MSSSVKTLCFVFAALFFSAAESQALTLGQAAQIAQTATPAVFNTIELTAPQSTESRVPQWHRAKAALHQDMKILRACLDSKANCSSTAMSAWRDLVVGLRGQDQMAQLNGVNQFFNQWGYVNDQANYGTSEYWASPVEFMRKSGDCEDYAIAKYVTLRFLGFDVRQMRITAVIDNSRGGIGHAILAVATDMGHLILDNQSNYVYNNAQQTAYAPRFAVNDNGVYTYAVQPQIMMASAQ